MEWVLLALLAPATAEPGGPALQSSGGQDTVTAEEPVVRLSISGSLDLQGVFRDEFLGGDTMILGRATLRFDVELPENLRAVVELENRSFDGGVDLPLGANPETTAVAVEQAYLEFSVTEKLHLRLGLQDFRFVLRPAGEPFFLDVSESESFFAAGTRDVLGPVGVTLRYAFADFLSGEIWWATAIEGGRAKDDEALYGIYFNGLLSERISWFVVGVAVSDPGSDRELYTVGLGVDAYLSKTRWLELFGELFGQFGPDHHEWAFHAGARVYGDDAWLELAVASRSEEFHSYENENRFAIVESAALGLDLDTNVWSVRVGAGWTFAKNVELRVDLGHFRLLEETADPHVGVEIDGTVTWNVSPQAQLRLRLAILASSEFAEDLGDDSESWLVAPEAAIHF